LRFANEHHPFRLLELLALLGGYVIFTLALAEYDHRNLLSQGNASSAAAHVLLIGSIRVLEANCGHDEIERSRPLLARAAIPECTRSGTFSRFHPLPR
jgi:hypothetical protein